MAKAAIWGDGKYTVPAQKNRAQGPKQSVLQFWEHLTGGYGISDPLDGY
jgi:hypothetical protein